MYPYLTRSRSSSLATDDAHHTPPPTPPPLIPPPLRPRPPPSHKHATTQTSHSTTQTSGSGSDRGESESDPETTTSVETTPPSEVLDHATLDELEAATLMEIDDYIRTHPLTYANPTFHEDLLEAVTDTLYEAAVLSHTLQADTDANRQAMHQFVQLYTQLYFHTTGLAPVRSYPADTPLTEIHPPQHRVDPDTTQAHIEHLRSQVLPSQRTPEWYVARHNLMTASDIYKVLGTEALFNSYVYSKCKPAPVPPADTANQYVNTHLSTHHGEKYEPVTAAIYQELYPGNTLDTTFGCITHPRYPFLGASPDGIITAGPRIGHMIEIKNRASAANEITGIPSLAYWVQTQLQMEVCDLERCELFETRIKEFPSDQAFYDNVGLYDYRGVILYFVSKEAMGVPKYVYMPPVGVQVDRPEVEAWIHRHRMAMGTEYVLMEVQYWYLEEMSCVVIPRNRVWFAAALPRFQEAWSTILRERVSGYEHRAPRRRAPASSRAPTVSAALMRVIKLDQEQDQG